MKFNLKKKTATNIFACAGVLSSILYLLGLFVFKFNDLQLFFSVIPHSLCGTVLCIAIWKEDDYKKIKKFVKNESLTIAITITTFLASLMYITKGVVNVVLWFTLLILLIICLFLIVSEITKQLKTAKQ